MMPEEIEMRASNDVCAIARPEKPVTVTTIWDRVHFHPATCGRSKMARYVFEKGRELIAEVLHQLLQLRKRGSFRTCAV